MKNEQSKEFFTLALRFSSIALINEIKSYNFQVLLICDRNNSFVMVQIGSIDIV
jgi:hypothetical protein